MFVYILMLVSCLPPFLASLRPCLCTCPKRRTGRVAILPFILGLWPTGTLELYYLRYSPNLDFTEQLFAYENWRSADKLLTDANQTAPNTKGFITSAYGVEKKRSMPPLTMVSLTVCNQHGDNSYPAYGASFAPADYHTQVEGRYVYECSHTHNPGGEHLAYLFPQLYTYWPSFLEVEGIQLPTFNDFIEQAYRDVITAARPGVAAWRFPPHSLASNTFQLLFSIFSTKDILIEGFGAAPPSPPLLVSLH